MLNTPSWDTKLSKAIEWIFIKNKDNNQNLPPPNYFPSFYSLLVLLRLFMSTVSAQWKHCIIMCYCASLPNSTPRNTMWVAWNWLQWEYLHAEITQCCKLGLLIPGKLVVKHLPAHNRMLPWLFSPANNK